MAAEIPDAASLGTSEARGPGRGRREQRGREEKSVELVTEFVMSY